MSKNTMPKPVALPRPPMIEVGFNEVLSLVNPKTEIKNLLKRREVLLNEVGLVEAEIELNALESICGGIDDTQDVELYDGSLGVTVDFVNQFESPIGQLQWFNDLDQRFNNIGESPGNVSGVRWGSGGLIEDNIFITAGHCFDQHGGGWQRPTVDGAVIEPGEIAQLMQINFNYQVDGDTNQLRPGEPFPVIELLEYRIGGLDFAIVRVGENSDGQLPGQIYETLTVSTNDLTQAGSMLCMIQHPAGRPKQIEAGPMFDNISGRVRYDSLDTLGGSSGSPILSEDGEVIGIHTNGGCSAFSGANFGVAIEAVRNASTLL